MFNIFLLLLLLYGTSRAQTSRYTTANAHSHNDYEQPVPFFGAYNHQFGSIEADIFLLAESDHLYVAHTATDLKRKRQRLDSLYLLPLANCIRRNNGYVYADSCRKLQLLIDIKTDSVATLNRLIQLLQKYPGLIHSPSLKIVISGSRPSPDSLHTYPSFIYFDGTPGITYSPQALSRIALLSISFRSISAWNDKGVIPEKDSIALAKVVEMAHGIGKPIRFWATPDTPAAWKELIGLQVDYINTDLIKELSSFLKGLY